MSRGRSLSPRPLRDADADMKEEISGDTKDAKVVIITNLTRNVVETHLRTIFGFYGEISKIDLPLYANSGQNRGKAALEYIDSESAHKAAAHMEGGNVDGATLKVELSNLPVRSRSRSRSRPPKLNGRRSRSRSRSVSRGRRSASRDDIRDSRSRSRSP
ncbi:hypothetical protein BDV98DRAFT_239486 [Pterulicium gracile]|uniref:RRM domain-containing protein n=1 Tax=Pterulicium gracile TaxID=1884261 RepID=A0A5C3R001_9AGAR|nr:hypothetical protein BDV98DRAFT_239486 [Pterula gracilis]